MNAAIDAETLDSLLAQWHQWAAHQPASRGFAPKSLVCGDYLISRQYDSGNGALDSDLHKRTMRSIDFQVGEMCDPWRSAIYALARNCATGHAVWASPRLPTDAIHRGIIIARARKMITDRLLTAGVM